MVSVLDMRNKDPTMCVCVYAHAFVCVYSTYERHVFVYVQQYV